MTHPDENAPHCAQRARTATRGVKARESVDPSLARVSFGETR